MHQVYRPVPRALPEIVLRGWTEPLGWGRAVALGLLVLGLGAGLQVQVTTMECSYRAARLVCDLGSHRPLWVTHQRHDLRELRGVRTTANPRLPLQEAFALYALASDGPHLPVPTQGIYRDMDGVWHQDGRLFEAAWAFVRARQGSFAIRQVRNDPRGRMVAAWAALVPWLALGAVLWAERKTRRWALRLDLNLRTARGQSTGLGGGTLTKEASFGHDPRLQRTDSPTAPHLPMLRVTSDDGTSLPALVGHRPEHAKALDQLADRGNRALTEGAVVDPGATAARRFVPSAVLAMGAAMLGGVVAAGVSSMPSTHGQILLMSSVDRCETEGVTLLRAGALSWQAPVGSSTVRSVSVTGPDGRTRSARVRFQVSPERTTTFDCARLVNAPIDREEIRAEP